MFFHYVNSSFTKIIRRSEIFEFYNALFSGAALGGFLIAAFGHSRDWILFFAFAGVLFSFLNWRNGRFPAQQARHALQRDALRYRGLYPPEGQESDEWVKRLVEADYLLRAIFLYRQLHPEVALGETRSLVEAMKSAT